MTTLPPRKIAISVLAGLAQLACGVADVSESRTPAAQVSTSDLPSSASQSPELTPAPLLDSSRDEADPKVDAALRSLTSKLEAATSAWLNATNSGLLSAFSEVYAPSVRFYGSQLTAAEAVKRKLQIRGRYPDIREEISGPLQIDVGDGVRPVVRFAKQVHLPSGNTEYQSYLVFEGNADTYRIVEESDATTDSSLPQAAPSACERAVTLLARKFVERAWSASLGGVEAGPEFPRPGRALGASPLAQESSYRFAFSSRLSSALPGYPAGSLLTLGHVAIDPSTAAIETSTIGRLSEYASSAEFAELRRTVEQELTALRSAVLQSCARP